MEPTTKTLDELRKQPLIVKVFVYPILWMVSVFIGTKEFFRSVFKPFDFIRQQTTLIDIHNMVDKQHKIVQKMKENEESN